MYWAQVRGRSSLLALTLALHVLSSGASAADPALPVDLSSPLIFEKLWTSLTRMRVPVFDTEDGRLRANEILTRVELARAAYRVGLHYPRFSALLPEGLVPSPASDAGEVSLEPSDEKLLGLAIDSGFLSLRNGELSSEQPAVKFDLAHLLFRCLLAAGFEASHSGGHRLPLSDVPRTSPSHLVLNALLDSETPWVFGYDGKFSGDRPVSRRQAVLWLGGLLNAMESGHIKFRNPAASGGLPPSPSQASRGAPIKVPGPQYSVDPRSFGSWFGQ